jgi:4,5-DOPA dioxygenase extradiol
MTNSLMPVLIAEHGIPYSLFDPAWNAEKKAWADALPRPKAVLILSGHWEQAPLAIGTTRTMSLVYDYYGFPQECYDVTYPAPGAPELASRVRELVAPWGPVVDAPERGWDHGVFVLLRGMYPEADVPVLQLSLPTEDPKRLYELGVALAPLREEGVLIVGGGYLIHNLRAGDFRPNPPVPGWAKEFDAWVADVVSRQDTDALLDYRRLAPNVGMALPTHEHFTPLLVAAGAASTHPGPVSFPITGFSFGAFTRRSVQYG